MEFMQALYFLFGDSLRWKLVREFVYQGRLHGWGGRVSIHVFCIAI